MCSTEPLVKQMDELRQVRNQIGAIRQLPPRNFHKRMYLLGAASYIILPPRKYQLVAALVMTVQFQHEELPVAFSYQFNS